MLNPTRVASKLAVFKRVKKEGPKTHTHLWGLPYEDAQTKSIVRLCHECGEKLVLAASYPV